jgi:hypothetical protein
VDEYLVPPLARSDTGGVSGALSTLATQLHTTRTPLSGLYLNDSIAARSRLERVGVNSEAGPGRCVVFANVYYLPSSCGSSVDERPAVVRLDNRIQADAFEEGPSATWQSMAQWNFLQRSKYLTSANDDTVTGVHDCCCTVTKKGGQCLRPGGRGMPAEVRSTIARCEFVEHIPVEAWEVRHFKYGLSSNCRGHPSKIPISRLSHDGKHKKLLMLAATPETRNALPTAWVETYERAMNLVTSAAPPAPLS